MNAAHRLVVAAVAPVLLASCATEIVGSLDSTVPASTTSTTVPLPTGGPVELYGDLVDIATGLSEAVVSGDRETARHKLAQAEALWTVLEPLIVSSGVDVLDETRSVVELVRTAVGRTRPADADKALRFAILLRDSAADLF